LKSARFSKGIQVTRPVTTYGGTRDGVTIHTVKWVDVPTNSTITMDVRLKRPISFGFSDRRIAMISTWRARSAHSNKLSSSPYDLSLRLECESHDAHPSQRRAWARRYAVIARTARAFPECACDRSSELAAIGRGRRREKLGFAGIRLRQVPGRSL